MENINVDEISGIILDIIDFFNHFVDVVKRLFGGIEFRRAWEDDVKSNYVPMGDAE